MACIPEPLLHQDDKVKLDKSQRSRIWQRIFWHMLQATLLEEFLIRVDPSGSPALRISARQDCERVAQKLHDTREKEPLPSYEKVPPPDYDISSYVISQSAPDGSTPFQLETMGLSLPVAGEDGTVLLRPQQQNSSSQTSSSNSNRLSRLGITGITREVSRRIRTRSSSETPSTQVHPMQPSSRPVSILPTSNLVQALQNSNNNSIQSQNITNQSRRQSRVNENSTESLTSAPASSSGSTRVSGNYSVKSCSCTLSRYRKIQQVRNSAFNAGEGITDADSWTRILLDREEVVNSSSESSAYSEASNYNQEINRLPQGQTPSSPTFEHSSGTVSTEEVNQEDEEAARLRHREMAFRTLCSEDSNLQAGNVNSSQSDLNSSLPSTQIITLIPFPTSNVNRQSTSRQSNANSPSNPQNNQRSSSTITSSNLSNSNSSQSQQRNSSRRNSRRFSSGFFGLSLGLGTMEEVRQQRT